MVVTIWRLISLQSTCSTTVSVRWSVYRRPDELHLQPGLLHRALMALPPRGRSRAHPHRVHEHDVVRMSAMAASSSITEPPIFTTMIRLAKR